MEAIRHVWKHKGHSGQWCEGRKAGFRALTLTNTLAEGKTHSHTYECVLSCTSGITQSQTHTLTYLHPWYSTSYSITGSHWHTERETHNGATSPTDFCHDTRQVICVWLREADLSKKCSFFEHCSKGLCPPPLLFEHLSYFAGGVWTSCGEFLMMPPLIQWPEWAPHI